MSQGHTGEAHMGKGRGLPAAEGVSLEADPPTSVEPSDRCSPGQQLDQKLLRELESDRSPELSHS